MRADESFAHEPDPASWGTGPTGLPPDEPELPADPTGVDSWERYESPPPYCDYCEREGHTFRSCPARDDELEELEP